MTKFGIKHRAKFLLYKIQKQIEINETKKKIEEVSIDFL
jgi:hypothetical protein